MAKLLRCYFSQINQKEDTMGYWISDLKSLPSTFMWYLFLVGDYRTHSLINNLFRDDFSVLAERIGLDAAIISQNDRIESDLQEYLKKVEGGKLGKILNNLARKRPGILILNKHPWDLNHFDHFMKPSGKKKSDDWSIPQRVDYITKVARHNRRELDKIQDDDVIIYIPFDILERVYASTNILISDIVDFAKNQNDNLLKKTLGFGRVVDSIAALQHTKFLNGVVAINYKKHHSKPLKFSSNNRLVTCMCGYKIRIPSNNNVNVTCPRCAVRLYWKGSPQIEVEGDNHKEVLDVANSFLENYYQIDENKEERDNKMETVLIITALEKELNPVLDEIDSPLKTRRTEKIKDRIYYVYEVSSSLTIICTSFMGMGQLNASIAIKEAVQHYQIDKVILSGICGGMDREMKYGDIIISDQIVDYELAKLKNNDTQVRWSVYRSDYELMYGMSQFKSSRWISYIEKLFPFVNLDTPKTYTGIVLSGNKVIADNNEIKRFKSVWSKAIAVEMEASGIAATLHQMKDSPAFIMVKAICDFADAGKSDDWQEYAAYISAAFVLDFIFSAYSRGAYMSKRIDIADKHQKLFSAIQGTYSLPEMNVLAFNIGVDFDEIGGTGKSEKIVELIKYCKRRNILNKLISQINLERDNILIDNECSEEFTID